MVRRAIVALLILLCSAGIGFTAFYLRNQPDISLHALEKCLQKTSDATFASTCLHSTIRTLLKSHAAAEILAYTVATTTPVDVQNQCHSIGHIIGIETYRTSESLEGAISRCSKDCQSACTHGVIGAAFVKETGAGLPENIDIAHADIEELKKFGKQTCADPTFCHAIGHLAFIATQSPLPALQLCDAVSEKLSLESCYHGVFMEQTGFEGKLFSYTSNPDGEATSSDPYVTGDCLNLDIKYQHACFAFRPMFTYSNRLSPEKNLSRQKDFCLSLQYPDRGYCLEGIANQSVLFNIAQTSLTSQQAVSFCDALPTFNDRTSCSLGMLRRYLFLNDAQTLRYCYLIKEATRKDICYTAAFQFLEGIHYGENVGPMCNNLPECTAQYGRFEANKKQYPDYRIGYDAT